MSKADLLKAQEEMKAQNERGNVFRRGLWREQHFTIQELSNLWTFDPETIRRAIKNDPEMMSSVAKLGKGEARNKRAYFTYAVPESVAARLHTKLCAAR